MALDICDCSYLALSCALTRLLSDVMCFVLIKAIVAKQQIRRRDKSDGHMTGSEVMRRDSRFVQYLTTICMQDIICTNGSALTTLVCTAMTY